MAHYGARANQGHLFSHYPYSNSETGEYKMNIIDGERVAQEQPQLLLLFVMKLVKRKKNITHHLHILGSG